MDKQYDFTNVADLACSLKMLNIEGSTEAFGTSNIIPNDLAFDLIGFKSLTKLVLTNVDCCPEKIQSISHVRTTLKVRKFQKAKFSLISALASKKESNQKITR